MYFSMKKIILLLISIVLITFCLPIIFTKRFQVVVATNVIDDVNNVVNSGVTETGEDSKTSEQGVTNQESMNPEEVNQEAVKDPEYNYGNYTKVKLLHQKDGSVEEINLDEYRSTHIGIVFQSYNLLPYLTALENITLAMDISKEIITNKKDKSLQLMKKVGLDESYANRKILKLSGGEQQRTAIARSLSYDSKMIVAD